jgi:hypothetical protein
MKTPANVKDEMTDELRVGVQNLIMIYRATLVI